MHRTFGIFIVGKLLLLNWPVSNAGSVSSLRFLDDLAWMQQEQDQEQNSLQETHNYRRPVPKIVDARDTSYLPEDIYDETQDVAVADSDERLNRIDRSLLPEYRNLCETVTRKVELKNDPNYEYQPPHYHEVFCKSYSLMDDEPQKAVVPSKQKCAHPSFHCVQRSRTLFLVRRRWNSECWEPITKVVASGCDCMWPVSTLGDVSIHY